jgi:methionyl-tRNA formyltransferase
MKTAFMGSDPIALPLLKHLRSEKPAGIEFDCVFTQPDRRSGRGMKLHMNAIKEWAIGEEIEVLQPVKCGADEASFLMERGIELVLVMAYGQILPRSLLEVPPLGTLNLHASLLPRLRGASPIHTAVALGLEETGVSLMRIIPKLDAGPVADMEAVSIEKSDCTGRVIDKLSQACIPLLQRTLPLVQSGKLKFVDQDEAKVTYCRIIEKTDNHLDFSRYADELANRIRAFQPWPGTVFPYRDIDLKILEAEVETCPDRNTAQGTLVVADNGQVYIQCRESRLRLLRLQRPGGKPLPSDEFIRGFPLEDGIQIESREMRPLEAWQPFPYKRKRN